VSLYAIFESRDILLLPSLLHIVLMESSVAHCPILPHFEIFCASRLADVQKLVAVAQSDKATCDALLLAQLHSIDSPLSSRQVYAALPMTTLNHSHSCQTQISTP